MPPLDFTNPEFAASFLASAANAFLLELDGDDPDMLAIQRRMLEEAVEQYYASRPHLAEYRRQAVTS